MYISGLFYCFSLLDFRVYGGDIITLNELLKHLRSLVLIFLVFLPLPGI